MSTRGRYKTPKPDNYVSVTHPCPENLYIPLAKLTILRWTGEVATRPVYTRYWVRYDCCGKEAVLSLDNVMRRQERGSSRCAQCNHKRLDGTKFGPKGPKVPRPYDIDQRSWPVPRVAERWQRRVF